MNTQQLKELRNALSCWQDDYDCDDDKEQYDMLGAAIDAVSRLEAAERERDELRLEIARIGGAKSIEVLRRDAAAGEVIYQFDCGEGWQDVDKTDYERYINSRGISTRKLYTAAQPAALPPEVTEPVGEWCLDDREGAAWMAGANWMRQQCLDLGAQQQKVVELPEPVKWPEIPFKYFSEEQVFSMLDSAGVKWEVKK